MLAALVRRRCHLEQQLGGGRSDDPANAPLIAYALFLLKVVAEVIDPVMGSSQLGRIERQIRTIEATNIRVMNLLLVRYPFIDRLQAGDGATALGSYFCTIASSSARVRIDSTGRISTSTFFKS
jgi:hypothetical protein